MPKADDEYLNQEKMIEEVCMQYQSRIEKETGLRKIKPMVKKANYLIDVGRLSEAIATSKDISNVTSSEASIIQAITAKMIDENFDELESLVEKFIEVELFDGATYLLFSMGIFAVTFSLEATRKNKLDRIHSLKQKMPYSL